MEEDGERGPFGTAIANESSCSYLSQTVALTHRSVTLRPETCLQKSKYELYSSVCFKLFLKMHIHPQGKEKRIQVEERRGIHPKQTKKRKKSTKRT